MPKRSRLSRKGSGARKKRLTSNIVFTKSDTGQKLKVIIGNDTIKAFTLQKPELRVIGKEKGESERKLEAELYREPVMTIDKAGKNSFNVDFSAGLMRGAVHGQDKKDLTEEVNVEMYHGEDIHTEKGWLGWIGLNPDDKRLDRFLDRL